MSPEQCRGAGDVDHRSDIYSFGCLLFHILVGRPPYPDAAPGDLIVAHLREAPPVPSACVPELPAAVDALVLRCLAKSVDERFQSMRELHAELGKLVTELGLGIASEPPPPPVRSSMIVEVSDDVPDDIVAPRRDRRWLVGGALVVVTAA